MYSFTDVYENSKIDLNSITYLFRPRFPMNEKEKEWVLGNSSAFCKLEYLDLGMACIDDEFIYELCLFDFERLRGIDLSGNPAITSAALQHILDSDSLGSHGPYRSDTWEPTVNIIVRIRGTRISHSQLQQYNKEVRPMFRIEPDKSPPVIGRKMLEVSQGTEYNRYYHR